MSNIIVQPSTTNPKKYNVIGTRPVRHDGADKVTGKAIYAADFALPNMAHGAYIRSPHAHAKIVRIDTSAALALDGVKAIVTGADLPILEPQWHGGVEGGIDFVDTADVYPFAGGSEKAGRTEEIVGRWPGSGAVQRFENGEPARAYRLIEGENRWQPGARPTIRLGS